MLVRKTFSIDKASDILDKLEELIDIPQNQPLKDWWIARLKENTTTTTAIKHLIKRPGYRHLLLKQSDPNAPFSVRTILHVATTPTATEVLSFSQQGWTVEPSRLNLLNISVSGNFPPYGLFNPGGVFTLNTLANNAVCQEFFKTIIHDKTSPAGKSLDTLNSILQAYTNQKNFFVGLSSDLSMCGIILNNARKLNKFNNSVISTPIGWTPITGIGTETIKLAFLNNKHEKLLRHTAIFKNVRLSKEDKFEMTYGRFSPGITSTLVQKQLLNFSRQ